MSQEEPLVLHQQPLEYLTDNGTLLQSGFWGFFKSRHGWEAHALSYTRNGKKYQLLALSRKIAGFIPVGYVPHGPDLSDEENREAHLTALAKDLQGIFPLACLFIRFDLAIRYKNEEVPEKLKGRLRKAPVDVQVPDTVILSLKDDDESLLSAMHKKTRYNIRLARKKGVIVKEAGVDKLDAWYDLYRETAERDKIALHSKSYYRSLFESANEYSGEKPVFKLYLATHEEDLLAGIIVSHYKTEAVYLYGASSNHKRNLMPAYLLQWEAICQAKKSGCLTYDFFGIPPSDDPGHPMHGLYRFKTGFGGNVFHRPGCWDYPYSWLFYPLYRILESIRNWYYKVFKKK